MDPGTQYDCAADPDGREVIKQICIALANELEDIEPAAERARWTQIIASALICALPQADRVEALDFLRHRHRQGLS
jgi:hypothetical protein